MVSNCWLHCAFFRILVRLSFPPYVFMGHLGFCELLVPVLGPFFYWVVAFFPLACEYSFYILILIILMICNHAHWKYHFLVCGLSFSFVYEVFFCVGLHNRKVVSFLSFLFVCLFMTYVFLYLQEILPLP